MTPLPGDRAHPLDLEGVDPRTTRIFGALMRAGHLNRQLMLRAMAEHDTPPGQAMCLRIVAAHDGATQREIGEMLHLSAPTVTSMLKRMERHGSITRDPDREDQRVTRVRLTQGGQALERRLRGILAGRLGQVLDAMPEGDRDELARLLDALADGMADALGEKAHAVLGGPAR
jgi:DNA-binding MarR family transcriptional regulator